MIDKQDIQYGFSSLLGGETIVRRQKRNAKNQKKIQFISIIKKYDEALLKSIMLQSQFNIDLSSYEEPFYSIIDEILLLSYGPDIYQLIAFFFYERLDESGNEQFLTNDNGDEIYIRTPDDLYNVIQKLYPGTFD